MPVWTGRSSGSQLLAQAATHTNLMHPAQPANLTQQISATCLPQDLSKMVLDDTESEAALHRCAHRPPPCLLPPSPSSSPTYVRPEQYTSNKKLRGNKISRASPAHPPPPPPKAGSRQNNSVDNKRATLMGVMHTADPPC